MRYDCLYLTCSKKLTGSQLSPPHGTNKKLKCEAKNKTMSLIGPVQSHCHEGSPVGKKKSKVGRICWKGMFWPGVKEWSSDGWWERGWWQRWVDKWMRRWIETRIVRLTNWIWKLNRTFENGQTNEHNVTQQIHNVMPSSSLYFQLQHDNVKRWISCRQKGKGTGMVK